MTDADDYAQRQRDELRGTVMGRRWSTVTEQEGEGDE